VIVGSEELQGCFKEMILKNPHKNKHPLLALKKKKSSTKLSKVY
jgi:hypothetical protein